MIRVSWVGRASHATVDLDYCTCDYITRWRPSKSHDSSPFGPLRTGCFMHFLSNLELRYLISRGLGFQRLLLETTTKNTGRQHYFPAGGVYWGIGWKSIGSAYSASGAFVTDYFRRKWTITLILAVSRAKWRLVFIAGPFDWELKARDCMLPQAMARSVRMCSNDQP